MEDAPAGLRLVSATPFLLLTWRTTDGDHVQMRVSEKNIAAVFVTAVVDNGWKLHAAESLDDLHRLEGCA